MVGGERAHLSGGCFQAAKMASLQPPCARPRPDLDVRGTMRVRLKPPADAYRCVGMGHLLATHLAMLLLLLFLLSPSLPSAFCLPPLCA